MDLRYAYPTKILLARIRNLHYVRDDFPLDRLEHITSLVSRLVDQFGDRVLSDLPTLLKTGRISPPSTQPSLQDWLRWIEEEYVPSEPSVLSPGAMSNAPDRFDGFHSFNLCCRSVADRGRHEESLRSYVTDRRVFEYWNEGDWIAADRLMGEIRSRLRDETCLNGCPGPCSADHIGPLSLGFAHRPEFGLLCAACNSAKGNRMMFRDVIRLRQAEESGEAVMSWYGQALWDARKDSVVDEETALRLSKLLRDNRHTAMEILRQIASEGHFAFLASCLQLYYADYDVQFENLRVEDHATVCDKIIHTPRETKYAAEQKARRCRVAFESLLAYFQKAERSALMVSTEEINKRVRVALQVLEESSDAFKRLDQEIAALLFSDERQDQDLDSGFRTLVGKIPSEEPENFTEAKQALVEAMALVAAELSNRWEDERYVRAPFDSEE